MCKCVNSDFAGATLKKQVDLFRDKLPVVTPTAPVPVHGCLLPYHSPARKIEETSILGRVEAGKSRVVDGAKSRIVDDCSSLRVRLASVLASCDYRRLDALGLMQIEDIRPPDKRNAGGPAVLAQHHVPGFVPLFEDFVVDDRR